MGILLLADFLPLIFIFTPPFNWFIFFYLHHFARHKLYTLLPAAVSILLFFNVCQCKNIISIYVNNFYFVIFC